MPFTVEQLSFSAGAWDSSARQRRDLDKYRRALAKMENLTIDPRGEIAIREGARWLADLGDLSAGFRLIDFEFNTNERYLLLLSDLALRVFRHGALVFTGVAPWSGAELAEIDYAQSLDTVVVTHKNHRVRQIQRQGKDTAWVIENAPIQNPPLADFGRSFFAATLTPGAVSGTGVTLTLSDALWFKTDVGGVVSGNGGTARITAFTSATEVDATVVDAFADTDAIAAGDWYFNRARESLTAITPAAATGNNILVTASAAFFQAADVGAVIDGGGGVAEIITFVSTTEVRVNITTDFTNTDPIPAGDWLLDVVTSEQAWSDRRGYPRRVSFHQDRLAFGGSGELPNTLWISKSGFPFDFDAGDALADEAVTLTLLSDQINDIEGLISARDLVIGTAAAQWATDAGVLKPETAAVSRHHDVGWAPIKPVLLEGAVVYVSRSVDGAQQAVVEVQFDDASQSYVGLDLSLLAGHLLPGPLDLSVRRGAAGRRANHVFCTQSDGTVAVLCTLRLQDVTGWGNWHTRQASGDRFERVQVVGETAYAVAKRTIDGATVYSLEVFDITCELDSAKVQIFDPPTATLTGLAHLEGESIHVIGDGWLLGEFTVSGGQVTLPRAVSTAEAGFLIPWSLVNLRPNLDRQGSGSTVAEIKRVLAVTVDGNALKHARIRKYGDTRDGQLIPRPVFGADLFDGPPPTLTGVKEVRLLGANQQGQIEIYGDRPGSGGIRAIALELV